MPRRIRLTALPAPPPPAPALFTAMRAPGIARSWGAASAMNWSRVRVRSWRGFKATYIVAVATLPPASPRNEALASPLPPAVANTEATAGWARSLSVACSTTASVSVMPEPEGKAMLTRASPVSPLLMKPLGMKGTSANEPMKITTAPATTSQRWCSDHLSAFM
ncbi:hypothetical protein D3C72_494140 [compost metagenome]